MSYTEKNTQDPELPATEQQKKEREEQSLLLSSLFRDTGIDASDEDLSRRHVTSGGIASVLFGANEPALRGENDDRSSRIIYESTHIYGNSATVYENEVYCDTSVSEGGCFYISSGGTAVRTSVNTFGQDFESSGGMHVFDGGTANDTTVGGYFAFLHVSSGGVANGVTVNFDGTAAVSAGGIANDVEVNEGGWLRVLSGGTANRTTITAGGVGPCVCSSGGVMRDLTVCTFGMLAISSCGTITGRIQFANNVYVTAFPGAVIDFDLTGIAPGTEARLTGLSKITWQDATYTLTISDTQAEGTYTLAENADEFDRPLIVQGRTGEHHGTLQTGGVLLTEDSRFTLTRNESEILSMTLENRTGAFSSEVIADGSPLGIGSGEYAQNVIGGISCSADEYDMGTVTGNTSLVIDGGEFGRNLYGGDRILSGSLTRNAGKYETAANISTTINGGTFSGYVVGGMCFNQKTSVAEAVLNGNVYTTMTGGTFNGKGFYGGCIAVNANSSAQTHINGNVSTVFRPESGTTIRMAGHVYAGSYRHGTITGSVSVVFSGGGTVDIAGEIWGGCSGDYYEIGPGGNKNLVSSISSDRLLSFTGFTGTLTCQKIRGVESIEFVRGDGVATHAALSGRGYHLSDIKNWTFEYGCDLRNSDFANDFTGDRLTLNCVPGEDEDFTDWTILTNSRAGAFAGFGDGLDVYLGSQKMSWDAAQGCFLGGGYRLALVDSATAVSMTLLKQLA